MLGKKNILIKKLALATNYNFNTQHTQVNMTDAKNPFQIRQELLNTAKEYVESMYNMQQSAIERQFHLAEEVMKKNEEQGMKMFQQTTENLEKYCKSYPGVDQILSVAKQFQDFVDNKKTKDS